MKCKSCGKEFKFKPNKKFCSKSCCDDFHLRKIKKYHKCVICGKKLDFKHAGKYCSKDCKAVKKRNDYIKNKQKLENKKLREEARKLKQAYTYLKEFNPNIEICLNCKNDVCEGECEKINTFIRG